MIKLIFLLFSLLIATPYAMSETLEGHVVPLVTLAQKNHQILFQQAKPVKFPLDQKTQQTIADLKATFKSLESPYGKPAGLAAPQIGVPLRIFIIQVPPEAKQKRKNVYDVLPPTVFINPHYVPISANGIDKDWEGCYSAPDVMGEVRRYNAIHFYAQTENGTSVDWSARGFLARLLQHETDHLNGKLYLNYRCEDCRFGETKAMMKIREAEQTKTAK